MPTFDKYGQEFANHSSVNAIEQNRPPLWSYTTGFSFSPCNSMVVEQILRDLKTKKITGSLFRPVTVLPALNNIFERILETQLMPYFQNGILGDFLSAYRKHHSCHTTLLRLVADWKQCRDRGDLVAMVAMDLS